MTSKRNTGEPQKDLFADLFPEIDDDLDDDGEGVVEVPWPKFREVPEIPDEEPAPIGKKGRKKKGDKKPDEKDVIDCRTEMLDLLPGGEEDWDMDVGIADRLPATIKRNFKNKVRGFEAARAVASRELNDDVMSLAFMLDSGAFMTMIPADNKNKLRDVRKVRPFRLATAGKDQPLVTEVGWMDFKLPGSDIEFSVEAALVPGLAMCLFSVDDLEAIKPPCGGQVEVRFWANEIKFGDGGVVFPVTRIEGMPHIIPEITSSTSGVRLRGKAFAARAGATTEAYNFAHRILGHCGDDCMFRTLNKSVGLPLFKQPKHSRPCQECLFGKMKAPGKGHDDLSTGLVPDRPGQVLCGDVFGKMRVPGLNGERYFISVSCQFTG